jgi:hypothetical protein
MPVRRRGSQVALAVLVASGLLAGCGCTPRIRRFEASPRVLCGEEKTVIRWDADGELAIALNGEATPTESDDCGPAGRDTVKLTLVARRHGEERTKEQEVALLHGTAAEPVLFPTTAIEATDVVAAGEKNPALWSGRVEVATVAACGKRHIRVKHGGRTATLPADATPSAALAGTALDGAWELRSPLTLAEQQDPARRPKQLKVLATIRCKPEQP